MSHDRWPSLFIPGVAKAGTTSMAFYLDQHPDISLCRPKEPHYFSNLSPGSRFSAFIPSVTSEQEYLSLFGSSPKGSILCDASTSYFWDLHAPERIRQTCPRPRFVILLRDPVERAFSHYLNNVREGIEQRDFEQCIEYEHERGERPESWTADTLYLDCSFYADGLRRYFDIFGREAVLVLVFEEFVASPKEGLSKALSHIDADRSRIDVISLTPQNPYARPRGPLASRLLGSGVARRFGRRVFSAQARQTLRRLLQKSSARPEMSESSRRFLSRLYRDDVRQCEELLNRRLPWRSCHALNTESLTHT